ncbi:MAG: hypothetical protein ABI583_15415 [Betaproteobacteria bacterium]
MNNHLTLQKDTVDEMLKVDAFALRGEHIDDDGFTLRLMDTLPTRKRLSPVLRFVIPFCFTLLASVFAVALTSAGSYFFDAYMDLMTETMTPSLVGTFVVLCTLYAVSIGGALSEK